MDIVNTKLLNKIIICQQTDKAYLIKIPKKSYFVWISKKFIWKYEYQITIGLIKDWEYRLINNNNSEVMRLTGIELLELFNGNKTIRNNSLINLHLEELEN